MTADNSLAVVPGKGLPQVQAKSAGELARRKIYAGIPDDDVALALAICQKYGFDPLLKHLVLIAGSIKDEASNQWTKRYNAYVTRDGLLHAAHTTGQLDGLEVNMGKDELGEWAECAVYRKDMSRPFRYRVYLSEYAREPRGAWKTHPRAMLTKTAEVFALRRAFDVALTPVEEMGLEEAPAGIPVSEVGSQDIQPGPASFRGQSPGQSGGGAGGHAGTEGHGGGMTAQRRQEQGQMAAGRSAEAGPAQDWPEDWPQEPPGGPCAGQTVRSRQSQPAQKADVPGGQVQFENMTVAPGAIGGNTAGEETRPQPGERLLAPPDWPQPPAREVNQNRKGQASPVNGGGNGRRRLF